MSFIGYSLRQTVYASYSRPPASCFNTRWNPRRARQILNHLHPVQALKPTKTVRLLLLALRHDGMDPQGIRMARWIKAKPQRPRNQNLPPDLPRNANGCKNDTRCRNAAVRLRRCSRVVIALAAPATLRRARSSPEGLGPRYNLARRHPKNHASGSVLVVERGGALWMAGLLYKDRRNVNARRRQMP